MTPKHQDMLDYMLSKITALYEADPQMAVTVINTATRSAHRLRGRLTVPADAERVQFVQDHGPTVEFTGRMLWNNERNGYSNEFWATLSGEWILLCSTPTGNRAYTFIGDERTPEQVLKATGYADWTGKLVKGMGWDKNLAID